ncbi:unnamed protein product [Penicillium salamii]|uniref:Methyltransferase domain-containing protein n=1 Tax=Penicillium salamii TaxID=1612424 RepID=A0A9W4JRQ6_9EURO|nr:unnamed protein product [Penicillium salamii]CAG8302779.1 unnamed protein product [Penicillium salamii]CAG8367331.1 unnamed protein product [Penicillium salamii]CAG8399070.1 unnamed protein product [Penicillium salamii]CAG8408599.1 unnamed protein product [Penicillium salamii]
MVLNRPLPISEAWQTPDVYIEALLSFSTTSVLFMNLCGGIHMVDFLTREPDLYTTSLPEDWREFSTHHDIQDIIHLLLREDIDPLRNTAVDQGSRMWNGGAFPPQTLLDYIHTVRQLTLQREIRAPTPTSELPKQVAMRMNRKKVHEVEHFSQYVASLSETVRQRRGEPVSHIVDFGSGQNYLGRTLVSPPYHKHIIAIERQHQYISGAKTMDVRAKLAENPKAQYVRKEKDSTDGQPDGQDGSPKMSALEATSAEKLTVEGLQIAQGDSNLEMLGEISLDPEELLGSVTKSPQPEKPSKEEVSARGTLSYIEHDIQDGYLEPVVDHIIHTPIENGASKREESSANLMVVSLHSCGNLVHHGIRSLILNPSIVAVAMIGCCYNLVTERLGPSKHELPVLQSLHPRLKEAGASYDPHGFPMSRHYENYRSPGATTGMKLNITARATAVQAPYNWGPKDIEISFTRHFFRALLQRILVDRNVIPRPSVSEDTPIEEKPYASKADSIIIGAVPKSAYKSFNAYVRAATIKMSQDPNYGTLVQEHIAIMTDEEINDYETRYLHAKKHMSVVWSLMGFSAQLIEAIIVVDRWQFLREQDSVKDCWVEPVFEYGYSPRNLAVIGLKK